MYVLDSLLQTKTQRNDEKENDLNPTTTAFKFNYDGGNNKRYTILNNALTVKFNGSGCGTIRFGPYFDFDLNAIY